MKKVIIREEFHRDGYGIWLLDERGRGEILVAKPATIEMESKSECFQLPEPTLWVSRQDMQPLFQSIINELVRLGFRADSDRIAGELSASKTNLEDMRKITDKLLNILGSK